MSDVFRPRLPRDPFTANPNYRQPWSLKLDDILTATACRSHRDVLLVLGAPTESDLEPLLQSQQLSSSLLIIVTHTSLSLPLTACPAIRVLRITQPLAVENSGALRLVAALEWAERVARIWRKNGGHGIQELSEGSDERSDLPQHLQPPRTRPASVFRMSVLFTKSTPSSPVSSHENLALSVGSRASSFRSLTTIKTKAPVDPAQRPFDALLNFLPAHLSDKALLKHSILVTTISQPFLAAAPHSYASVSLTTLPRSRSSTASRPVNNRSTSSFARFRRNSSFYPSPAASLDFLTGEPSPSLPKRKSHLIHLLPSPSSPSSCPNSPSEPLTRSIEAFLLSFSHSHIVPSIGAELNTETAACFLMPAHALKSTLRVSEHHWCIADLVFAGLLDREALRAWLGGALDVRVLSRSMSESSQRSSGTSSSGGSRSVSIGNLARHAAPLITKGKGRVVVVPLLPDELTPPPSPRTVSPLCNGSPSGSSAPEGAAELIPTPPDSESDESTNAAAKKPRRIGWKFWLGRST